MFKFCGWVLPLLVIIFTLWTFSWSMWIVIVAALLMLLKGFGMECGGKCDVPASKPAKKKKK